MALTAERYTTRREGARHDDPVAAAKTIYAGALVVLDASGNAEPGTTATGKTARGVARETVDNSAGAAGAVNAPTEAGVFRFANAAADPIDRSHIGGTAYVVDDESVAATDGAGTRSAAGVIEDLDANGVWVRIGV